LLGSGHGRITPEISLATLMLVTIHWAEIGELRHLKELCIVIYDAKGDLKRRMEGIFKTIAKNFITRR